MIRLKRVIIIASIGALFPVLLLSQSLDHLALLAHYPLVNSANDTMGNYNPMILGNTPFQDGGIYCNGIYEGPDACYALTPSIKEFSSREFAVSLEFKVSKYYDERKPIIVCGTSWRWQYVFLSTDSTIGFYHDGDFNSTESTSIKYSLDEWHIVVVTYDSLDSEVKLYLDGVAIDSAMSLLKIHDDRRFSISHGSVGSTFEGILKNLKIYSTPKETQVQTSTATELIRN